MRLLLSTIAAIMVAITIAGCARGQVQVVDLTGKPIQDAQVAPVSLSMNGKPMATDDSGEASVPLNIGQDIKWVDVSKPGFAPTQVQVPPQWPMKVVLQPATQP
jgi:hypothetical protein